MVHRYFKVFLTCLLFSFIVYAGNHDIQESAYCPDTSVPTIHRDIRSNEIRKPQQIHTISFIGAGIGHVNSPAFKQVSINFFISHLWEVLSRCAVGIGGDYTTDINNASLASVTGVINLYPFQYGTTPYLGIEAGGGYAQVPGKTDFGIAGSAETGVLAIKVSGFLIGVSARLTFFTIRISEEHPVEILLKVGILL